MGDGDLARFSLDRFPWIVPAGGGVDRQGVIPGDGSVGIRCGHSLEIGIEHITARSRQYIVTHHDYPVMSGVTMKSQ
jgi:hypothetical protein